MTKLKWAWVGALCAIFLSHSSIFAEDAVEDPLALPLDEAAVAEPAPSSPKTAESQLPAPDEMSTTDERPAPLPAPDEVPSPAKVTLGSTGFQKPSFHWMYLGAGLTFAGVDPGVETGTTVLQKKAGPGAMFGIEYPFDSVFYIQPEIVYAPFGFSAVISGVNVNYTVNVVRVPVFFKARLPIDPPQVVVVLAAGPSVGISLGGTGSVGAVTGNATGIQTLQYGFEGLAGFDIELSKSSRFFLQSRFYFGLNNVVENPAGFFQARDILLLTGGAFLL